jgi:hypothetical protein
MAAGQPLASGASAMSGLQSGAACQFVATIFDDVSDKMSDELAAHAEKLSAAAEAYRRADEDLGRRLRHLAE